LFDEPKLIERVCARCSVFKEQALLSFVVVLAATFIYYHTSRLDCNNNFFLFFAALGGAGEPGNRF